MANVIKYAELLKSWWGFSGFILNREYKGQKTFDFLAEFENPLLVMENSSNSIKRNSSKDITVVENLINKFS